MSKDKFQEAYDRLEKSLIEAQDHDSKLKGACVDCKYFSPGYFLAILDGSKDWECRCPLVSNPEIDSVTGEMNPGYFKMAESYEDGPRQAPQLCGKYRDLFVPKLTWWQRIFGE